MARRLVVKLEMTIELQDDASSDEHSASSAHCKHCGWSRAYPTPQSAHRGLAAHLGRCAKRAENDAEIKNQMSSLLDNLLGK